MWLFTYIKKHLRIAGALAALTLFIGISLPVVFSQPVAAATPVTFDTETNSKKLFQAIKYYATFVECQSSFKQVISGDDISKGPRWWMDGGGTIYIGRAVDQWGDKNGMTSCNGEGDSEVGWLEAAYKLFGLELSDSEKALKSLGYECKVTNGTKECKKDNAKSDNGVISSILNLPYLKGTTIKTASQGTSTYRYQAALYDGANTALKSECEIKKGGNTNIVTRKIAQADGSIKSEQWSHNGKRDFRAGLDPLNRIAANNQQTCNEVVELANGAVAGYQTWSGRNTCASRFPDMASDSSKLTACAEGFTHAKDYSYCFNSGTGFKRQCYLGQGLPASAEGETSGEICERTFPGKIASIAACIAGSANRANANYCNTTYPAPDAPNQSDTNAERRAACTVGMALQVDGGGGLVAPVADPADPEGEEEKSSCVIDGVGWIVCSAANFLAGVSDGIYGLVENMLKVPIVNTNTGDSGNGVYNAWTIMRSFANVTFVIVFMIIIFAQLTGMGVSNYGVKKTLPRLVIAAILVNVSFWVSAIAVDISNIAGAGIYDLLSGVKESMGIGISSNWGAIITALIAGNGLAVAGGAVVAGAAVATGVAISSGGGLALAFLAIPLVLSAVLAVFILAFILIARQALIVILIVVSPLAFVAMLLPNTQKWFTKWRQTLTSLLLMYPVVSLLFGGAQVAGLAILASAGSVSDPIAGGVSIITGQMVMVAPFFFLPSIIKKFSGGNLDSIASNISNRGKRLIGGVSRKAGKSALGRSWNTMKYGNVTSTRGGRIGRAFRGIGSSAAQGGVAFDQWNDQKSMTDSYLKEERTKQTNQRLGSDTEYATRVAAGDEAKGQVYASRAIASAEAEELKRALEPLRRTLATMSPEQKATHLKQEVAAGGSRASAALHYGASVGDTGLLREGLGSGNADTQRMTRQAIDANASAVKGKAPDLVKGSQGAFGSFTGSDMAQWDSGTAKAFAKHMQHMKEQSINGTLPPEQRQDFERKLSSSMRSFDGASEDISRSADLQAVFKGDVGVTISHEVSQAGIDPSIAAGIQTGLSKIGPDGKIR